MPRDKNIFTLNPTSLDMKRSVFPIKVQHKTSLNMGDIVPIYFKEILPGDTISLDMAHIIRTSSPLIAPIMDNIYADVYFFFVPNRLVWEHWEQFCGANETTAWTQQQEYLIPTAAVYFDQANIGTPVGSIGNYLGLPSINTNTSLCANVSELPLRAYYKIYNDWFRDENSIDPVLYTIGDTQNTTISYDDHCRKASRFHDLFSTCLPAPQKGASVKLPLGESAVVFADGITGTPLEGALVATNGQDVTNGKSYIAMKDSSNNVSGQLYADLSNATAATVNAVRMAFQLQKLLEKDARGGRASA